MSSRPTPNPRLKKRLQKITKIGKKRLNKLEKIEKRQRKTFNRILRCPSCRENFGTNSFCVTCQMKKNQKNDIF